MTAASSITILSRVLGFVRDTILARILGVGLATDAFSVAFKLPNLLRRALAEEAFSQAFAPILAEYENQQGEEATRTLTAYVSGSLTLALALVTALGILATPWVIWVTAPGFADTPEKFALTTDLLRATFPYILLVSLLSLAGMILNAWNRFSVPAFVLTLPNAAMIGFALFLTPYFDPSVMVLGWAMLTGGLLQLLYQLPHLRKIGMLMLPRLNLRDSGAWWVMKLMLPAILGVSMSQILLIINTIFTSFLAAGLVSRMYCTDRLIKLSSGALGVVLGMTLLPMLAKIYSNKDRHGCSRLLNWGLHLCFLPTLPYSLALAIPAEPLTVSLSQYDKFTMIGAAMTQRALTAYFVGLLDIILVKAFVPGFYAQQNIRVPVKIALFTLVSTQLVNLTFIGPLQRAGLALSIGLAAYLNAGLLYRQLCKQRLCLPQPGWAKFLVKSVATVLVMSAVLLATMHQLPAWEQGVMLERFLCFSPSVVAGPLAYFDMPALLGFRLRDFPRRAVL